MMQDIAFKFSDGQVVSADAASTNILKFSATRKLFGGYNKNARLMVYCEGTSGATTPTLNIKLVGATSTDLSTGSGVIFETGTLTLVTGKLYQWIIPNNTTAYDHYGISYDITGTTSVTVQCTIICDAQENLLS